MINTHSLEDVLWNLKTDRRITQPTDPTPSQQVQYPANRSNTQPYILEFDVLFFFSRTPVCVFFVFLVPLILFLFLSSTSSSFCFSFSFYPSRFSFCSSSSCSFSSWSKTDKTRRQQETERMKEPQCGREREGKENAPYRPSGVAPKGRWRAHSL